MLIGMLWFDNDPKVSLEVKVGKAVEYYKVKYGKTANLCFVHPSMSTGTFVGDVEVRSTKSVLPNHFWVGVGK